MIIVRKPTSEEREFMQQQSTWGCKASTFDWQYNEKETALLIKGKVKVKYDGGEAIFGAGDYVIFPKGLNCVWIVSEDVEKYYYFGD